MFDLNWMNWNSAKAAGKHLASFVAGAITLSASTHIISMGDANSLTQAFNSIIEGITKIGDGLTIVAGIVVPLYTMWKSARNASPKGQATGLQAAIPGTVILTSKALADDTPQNPNIVSKNENVVVPKQG